MILTLCIMTLAVGAGGAEGFFWGEIPENVPTFRVVLSGQDSGQAAAVIVDGDWFRERDASPLNGKHVELVYDTPWQQQVHDRILLNRASLDYETPALRKSRLKENWEQRGYTLVNTPQGERHIKKEDLDFAARARDMARDVAKQLETPELDMTAAQPVETQAPPSFVQQWWRHAALAIAGVVILVVTGKLFFS